MGGGRATATGGGAIVTFTSTPAIVGVGTTNSNAKSIVPQKNFFIFCYLLINRNVFSYNLAQFF
jgi:hypothetical protein